MLISLFDRSFVEKSNLIIDGAKQNDAEKNAAPAAVRMSPSSIDVSGGPEQLSSVGRSVGVSLNKSRKDDRGVLRNGWQQHTETDATTE